MKSEFILLLNSKEKKSIIGPKLLKMYCNLSYTDYEDLREMRELIDLSPYSEIPELVNLYGPLINVYGYNEMRAGLWLRKFHKKMSTPLTVREGRYYDNDVGLAMFNSGFTTIRYISEERTNLARPGKENVRKRFEKWCNLVALDRCCSYKIVASECPPRFVEFLDRVVKKDYYYVDIIKIEHYGEN